MAPTHSSRPPRPAHDRRSRRPDRFRGPKTPTVALSSCRRPDLPPRPRRAAPRPPRRARRFTPPHAARASASLPRSAPRRSSAKLQVRRTIFISHNASSVCAALRPPPTPFTVRFSHRLPPPVTAAQSFPCCAYSQVARVYTNSAAAAATRSTGACRTCTEHQRAGRGCRWWATEQRPLRCKPRDLNLRPGGGERRPRVPIELEPRREITPS